MSSTEITKESKIEKLDPDNPYSLVNEDNLIRYPKLNELPSNLSDKTRPIFYPLTAIRAELKFVFRKLGRELMNLLRLFDLIVLLIIIGIGLVVLFVSTVYVLPFTLSLLPESIVGDPNQTMWGEQICKLYENGNITYSAQNCDIGEQASKTSGWPFSSGYVDGNLTKPKFTGLSTYMFNLWTSDTTLRIMVGVVGGLGVIVRLLFKADIDKFRDKVNARKDVTYVFGSTVYAEKFLTQLVFSFGYADEAALISDEKYLWVERIAGLLDTYVSPNLEEFEKSNMYTILGFANAKRVYILTDSIDRNQNILTNIRSLRPDVPIYILSQYTPDYLKGDLVKDDNLFIIQDMDITREGLVKSLSLNIKFPETSEINAPRNYIGKSPLYLTNEVPDLEVLAVKRPHLDDDGWDLLLPEHDGLKLQRTDRILLHITHDFRMKEANRIVTELPVRHLADLGELKYERSENRYITGKITEIPGRSLYLEPKSARKSWQRRVVGLTSIIFIVLGVLVGRGYLWRTEVDNLGKLTFGFEIDLFLFIFGILGIFLYRSMYPILQKGIIEFDGFEKTIIRRKKSFKRGKDTSLDISKMKDLLLVIVEPNKGNKQFRNYYLVDENEEKYQIVSILWKKNETNAKKIEYLKRFENRLESYIELEMHKAHQTSDEITIIDEEPDDDESPDSFGSDSSNVYEPKESNNIGGTE